MTAKKENSNNISLEIYGISMESYKNTIGNMMTKNMIEKTVRINTIGVPLLIGTS